jgi:hypothetical protein
MCIVLNEISQQEMSTSCTSHQLDDMGTLVRPRGASRLNDMPKVIDRRRVPFHASNEVTTPAFQMTLKDAPIKLRMPTKRRQLAAGCALSPITQGWGGKRHSFAEGNILYIVLAS